MAVLGDINNLYYYSFIIDMSSVGSRPFDKISVLSLSLENA